MRLSDGFLLKYPEVCHLCRETFTQRLGMPTEPGSGPRPMTNNGAVKVVEEYTEGEWLSILGELVMGFSS